ncbi:MAG: putative adhesin, partial [Bacteroidota bacterium]
TTSLGDGNQAWTGDANLEAIILSATGQAMNSRNATVIEFDFVPLIDTISFDFLFASEEYGTFQCSYSDAFAFLLTNQVTNTTTNLAIIPNTTTPISVVTVRDAAYNTGCASVNPQYFDVFNGGANINTANTNYNGQVVPLTATSSVVPFTNYHIKMVIADRSDNSFDSVVFLEEGSFNIGQVELGNDLLASAGQALCPGESYVLDSGLAPNLYTFQWSQNGQVIPNQTGSTLNVTSSGTYSLSAQYGTSTCFATDSIIIEFNQPMALTAPQNLTICNSSGYSTFDLTQNTPVILNSLSPTQYTVSYHTSQADAQAYLNPISSANAYINTIQWSQTIYVRIKNNSTGCVETRTFNIVVQDLTPQFTITSNFSLCSGTSGTITVTPTNYTNSEVTYSWSLNGNALTDTTPSISVNQAGTYTVVINRSGCSASGSTVVSLIAVPVADNLPNVNACDEYILPTLSTGNSYRTAPNGGGNVLSPGTIITTSQTIYVFAQTSTNPNCTDEESFDVTITNSPDFTISGACMGSQFVLTVNLVNPQNYSYQWYDNLNQIVGTNTNTLQISEPGTYSCAVSNTSGFVCTTNISQAFDNIICQIQRGISPNGDGLNDYLELTAEKVEIFNRYGSKVYSKVNYHNDWFGQSDSGSVLPDGTYYYSVKLLGGELKTGWIYINKEN